MDQAQAINNSQYLPKESKQAMHALVRITKNLIDVAKRELEALTLSDMMSFAILQDEKEGLAQRYSYMAREFSKRIREFKGTDPALLDQLGNLQQELGDRMRENNRIVVNIRDHSYQNTHGTLFTAQELAGRHPVRFPEKTAQDAPKGAKA